MFSCEFCETSRKKLSYRTTPVAASGISVETAVHGIHHVQNMLQNVFENRRDLDFNFAKSFSKNNIPIEKIIISKKRDFFDQALAFLPPGKPDLYKSHSYFFFLNTVLLPLSSTLSFYKGY